MATLEIETCYLRMKLGLPFQLLQRQTLIRGVDL